MIKFGRFMRLIELINSLRSSVHAGVLCLRRLTKRISTPPMGADLAVAGFATELAVAY